MLKDRGCPTLSASFALGWDSTGATNLGFLNATGKGTTSVVPHTVTKASRFSR